MIVVPRNKQEWEVATQFLALHAHVVPSFETKILGWVEQDHLKIAVGFTGFMGKVCQIHVAMAPHYHFAPRAMLEATFDYAFNQLKREKLIGIVNSLNTKAMRFDTHLGFTEEHRLEGMHDDGGDIVILSMHRDACRYLTNKKVA